MFNPLFRTIVKVVVASLVVGTILTHFGVTAERLISRRTVLGFLGATAVVHAAGCGTGSTGDAL